MAVAVMALWIGGLTMMRVMIMLGMVIVVIVVMRMVIMVCFLIVARHFHRSLCRVCSSLPRHAARRAKHCPQADRQQQ